MGRSSLGTVDAAFVRVRLAAVAVGRAAAAPPIPHLSMRGFSDPPLPVSTATGGRASRALHHPLLSREQRVPGTSAQRARNARSATVPSDLLPNCTRR